MTIAAVNCCLSSSCFTLQSKLKTLSLKSNINSSTNALHRNLSALKTLSFSNNLSHDIFSKGNLPFSTMNQKPIHRFVVVCEAAPKKRADSAAKRARQAEKRRIYNKAKKSEVKTRMKKVLDALDVLRKKPEAEAEEIFSIEKLIAEAYSVIDKAVKVGTLHRNTGARRKSRLARRKKAVEIHHGWYAPAAAENAA
ncbi:30S ribosomal protein S20 [Hibiscus syriacus]|uniref:Small ribosomal subunit protein bS20c n=1 Tax=Hibiscus syriacus TaxID=106335 RepID=A0A6A2ZKM1_HIBSY|nr:30S ribosomal protein S20, chloroplastic-like isoform X1 [Hibiscus syriacus]KAE8692273.1 30S ribosomal protein S20 [Hibiscus syriacus]